MWFMTIIFIMVDFVSKYVVTRYINLNDSIIIIKNFLSLTYVRNTGVAFSILTDNKYLVMIISFMIISGIVYYIYHNKPKSTLEKVGYSLILGGAIGNFLDRLFKGYVIDFIDVKIFSYDYPIFNLADTFIVIGVLLIGIYTWRCKDGNKS